MDAPSGDPRTPRPLAGFPPLVGRYRLLAPLGVGGGASVFLGRAEGIGGFAREVAVKLMHPHLRQDPAFVRDFLREARLAARIRHPNVVPVVDVGETDDGVFLVMEWVEGVSLAELIDCARAQDNPLPAPIGLRILCDALAGLHAAHEVTGDDGHLLGVVHRDFTPHNILVGTSGLAQLSDFGIAKPTRLPGHTSTGIVKGKIPYMAPEQVQGGPLDRTADVFAAGVVAWELLTGRRLHPELDEAAMVLRVATCAPPSLREILPDAPAGLRAAVDGALAMDRARRCSTAEALRVQLVKGALAMGGIAEAATVARFVREVAGPTLDQRRTGLRHGATPATTTPPLQNGGAASGRPGRRVWWMVAASAAVGLAAAIATLATRESPARRVSARSEAPASSADRPAAPDAAAATSPLPAVEPAPPERPAVRSKKHPAKPPPMADNPYR